MRRYATTVGLKENYSIYDMSDAKQAMKRAIEAAEVSTTHASPEQIAGAISRAKNQLFTPEVMQSQNLSPKEKVAARVYPVYQRQLLTANAVDFDDLLLHVANMLRHNPELRRELDERFRYILVDEYQDTNLAQYAIVRAPLDRLSESIRYRRPRPIDLPDGAERISTTFWISKKITRPSKRFRLEQNYRSTPNILRVADQLIRHNRRRKQKDLFTENDEGDKVILRMFESGYEESDSIADEIVSAVSSDLARPSDFAIFLPDELADA